MRLVVALLFVGGGVTLLDGCATNCTLVGCAYDGIEMCVPLASPTRIRVCRNGACSDVTYTGSLENYTSMQLGAITRDENCVSIEMPKTFRDGDAYSLTGWDANGNETDNYEFTATYRVSYPNGARCGPECVSATLTDTTP